MPVQCLDFNSHNPLEAMECILSQGGPEDENEVYFGSKPFEAALNASAITIS